MLDRFPIYAQKICSGCIQIFSKLSLDKIVQVNISYFLHITYRVVFSLSV